MTTKSRRISEDDIRATKKLIEEHGSLRAASRATGIARTTLQRRTLRGDSAVSVAPADPLELRRVKDKASRLSADLAAIQREAIDAAIVRQAIFGLAAQTPRPPEWLVETSPSSGREQTPTVILSDWHLGEVVTPGEVNGLNAFDMEIGAARVRRLVERTIDLCFSHTTNPRFDGIVVPLIGDIVSGEIHPELEQTNELELFPTILRAADLVIWVIEQFAARFGRVFVPFAPGNHGRTTRKPQAKRYVYRNADWLIACLVERHFKSSPEVRFVIPEVGEVLYSIYGHRYLAMHGDQMGVKGGDGIIGAIGPIMRGTLKVGAQQSQMGRDFDTLLAGHWHQTLWLPRCIVNNSLKGFDEYAMRFLRAPYSAPSTSLWFTHHQRGITARWEVALEDKAAKGGEWCSWRTS